MPGLLFDEKKYQPQKLRDYQEGGVQALVTAWDKGEAAPLAALATGAGKTTIISELLRRVLDPNTQRALVVGHTEEIISQLRDRIANQFNGALDGRFTDRFSPGIGVVMAEHDAADARVVAATRQSLHPTRLQKLLLYGKFDYLLIDLAVMDVRALEVGTLLGKMTLCKGCGIEHFAGLKACPACGYVRPWKERLRDGAPVAETEASTGDKLLANYEALFEKSFAAWFNGGDGFFSCTLSFEDGAFIIVPPLEDNYYRLALVPKEGGRKVEYLDRNEDLSSLMLNADTRVKSKGNASADKNAAWRDHPATMAQVNLLSKMGVNVAAGMSKGSASQLITHHIAVKRLVGES